MYEVLKERKSLIALSGMTGMSNKRKVHKSSMHCTVTGKRRRRRRERELGPFYINVSLKKAYIAIAIL